jgi:hypothetical protein
VRPSLPPLAHDLPAVRRRPPGTSPEQAAFPAISPAAQQSTALASSVEALETPCSRTGRRASPAVGQPRLAPPATAPRRSRGHLDPNSGRESNHGDPLTPLPTFPGESPHRSAGIWASAAALHGQGPHCKGLNIPRGLGAKRNSNSVAVLLFVVNCVENHR